MMMKSVQRALTFGLVLAVSGMASAAVAVSYTHLTLPTNGCV